jgi:hypothetical protein
MLDCLLHHELGCLQFSTHEMLFEGSQILFAVFMSLISVRKGRAFFLADDARTFLALFCEAVDEIRSAATVSNLKIRTEGASRYFFSFLQKIFGAQEHHALKFFQVLRGEVSLHYLPITIAVSA